MNRGMECSNSTYYTELRKEIQHNYRRVGHALDNYGGDMDKGLYEALKRLYEATEEALQYLR